MIDRIKVTRVANGYIVEPADPLYEISSPNTCRVEKKLSDIFVFSDSAELQEWIVDNMTHDSVERDDGEPA